MNLSEKEISYKTINSYSTLNKLTSATQKIIFTCHGMGYLSRYFLKYFKELNSTRYYIIAPQAQSKYYIAPKMKYVGSSWLTKENTLTETNNIINYFDKIFKEEKINTNHINYVGYSQGVSVIMRFIAKRKIQFDKLLIMSGGIPKELHPNNFMYLKKKSTVYYIYGDKDEYINGEFLNDEIKKIQSLFIKVKIICFEGKHKFNEKIIKEIIK